MKTLSVGGKKYKLPIFLPDATRAFVKRLDSADLKSAKIDGVMVNTYHLIRNPGIQTLKLVGGIKKFMGFNGLVASDSGGWQIFSLIHRNGRVGEIRDGGVVLGGRIFTPEDCVDIQLSLGSDMVICLDDFTDPKGGDMEIKRSVERTILWAKRCKKRFEEVVRTNTHLEKKKPLIFAVIQGGMSKRWRKKCAEGLLDIGFDGYGYGGYTVDSKTGELDEKISQFISDLIPQNKIKFSLGTGKPWEVAKLWKMGWDIFDCTLPTRDARHRRLYVFKDKPLRFNQISDSSFYSLIDIGKSVYKSFKGPADKFCDCLLCKNHSLSYLHHLFVCNDPLAERLASIHNLRTYSRVVSILRGT